MTGPAFRILILSVLALSAFAASPARAASCAALPAEIVVRTSHETVRDDSLTLEELDRMGKRLGQRHTGLERQLQDRGYRVEGTPGLTEFKLRSDGRFDFEIRHQDDRVCVSTSRLTVELKATSTIHVAREYPPGSCEHEATLEHERQHAELNARFVKSLADPFRLDLRRALGRTSVSGPAKDAERLQEKLTDAAGEAIGKATGKAMKDLGRRQGTIDTGAEYIRLSRTCRNW